MYSFKLLVIAALLLPSLMASVFDLRSHEFKEKVLDSKLPVLVMFKAEFCGHCKRALPDVENAARLVQGTGAEIFVVECGKEKSLCQEQEINSYPTFKLFNDGSSIRYHGDRTSAAILKFVWQYVDTKCQKITSSNQIKQPAFIAFTDMDYIPIPIRFLEQKLGDQINFYYASNSDEKLKQSIGMKADNKSYLVAYNDQAEIYQGKWRKNHYLRWARSFLYKEEL